MAGILAIDDDEDILAVVKKALEKDGHMVSCCNNLKEFDLAKLAEYDLILLDVMMPYKDGFTFCREVRNSVDCPILFLTAKTMDNDLEFGFLSGADDYIKKPFSIIELRARVNAHLRRQTREHHTQLVNGKFRFNLSSRELFYEEKRIKLTKSEYRICEFLVQNRGQVFSLEQMIEKVSGYDTESDSSAIREHIKNIRAKLKNCGESPIETVWGIGYKWK